MPTLLASDNFDRADENPLAGNWTTTNSESAMAIVTNVATYSAVGADCGAYYNAVTCPNDQSSKGKLSTAGGSAGGGQGAALKVRQATGANTCYRLVVDHAASNNVDLQKFLAGVESSVAGYPRTQAWTDNDTWEVRAIGTTLSAWLNGVQVGADATDSSIASGSFGIGYSSTEGSSTINDWEGWDYTSVASVALTGTATSTITEADVVAGGKTIVLTLSGTTWIAS